MALVLVGGHPYGDGVAVGIPGPGRECYCCDTRSEPLSYAEEQAGQGSEPGVLSLSRHRFVCFLFVLVIL